MRKTEDQRGGFPREATLSQSEEFPLLQDYILNVLGLKCAFICFFNRMTMEVDDRLFFSSSVLTCIREMSTLEITVSCLAKQKSEQFTISPALQLANVVQVQDIWKSVNHRAGKFHPALLFGASSSGSASGSRHNTPRWGLLSWPFHLGGPGGCSSPPSSPTAGHG